MRLFHFSETPSIEVFEPRPSAASTAPIVWAVDSEHMAHNLLPRDCPRVCFRAEPDTTASDRADLLGEDSVVIAVEAGWMDRVNAAILFRYAMPSESFQLKDANAGYWISGQRVVPDTVEAVSALPEAMRQCGVAVRIVPSLWELHDAVAGSSLGYSMIRMRNAQARVA